MSKQDIEKRLGFAAQGVKAEMASIPGITDLPYEANPQGTHRYKVGDQVKDKRHPSFQGTIKRLMRDKYGYPSYVVYTQGGGPQDAQDSDLVLASRPGAKAKMAASDIIVKKDAQYIYYYPENDDRATFADDNGKGAYTVKSNRTGKPVSAKTYRSFQEAAAASNAMNEKLPPLKKAKSSRPGAKAKMAASFEDRQRAAGYKWQVRYTKQLGKTDSNNAMEIDETLAFATESAARKWADTMIKKGWYKGTSGTPEKVLTAKVVPFARPGVKAKFEKEYVLWGLPKGETDAIHQQVLSTQAKTPAQMEDVKKRAAAAGWHSFRVQILDLSKPYKGFARPGAKAKFATEVGRKGNKSAMISRDATGTWYAYVVQRIETGIGKEEDMLGTMRSYSTEDRAKRAAIKALDTSGFSRPGAKAKA